MTTRHRRPGPMGLLLRAGAFSLAVHVVAVMGLLVRAAEAPAAAWTRGEGLGEVTVVATNEAEATRVELVPAPEDLSAPLPAPAVEAADAISGDRTRTEMAPSSPRLGASPERASPAPDTGAGSGRALAEVFRRDSSTLRTRLSDGARVNQPSRERTARTSSSPQATRQEPRVGLGDSSRSRHPVRPVAPPLTSDLPLSADEEPEELAAVLADPAPPAPGKDLDRGDGPLDATLGTRRFDTVTEGAARDHRFVRAGSDATHPGRLELSAPAARGLQGDTGGRGPGELPGAVPLPSRGDAPAVTGAAVAVNRGAVVSLPTSEREYQRTFGEIRRRVTSALRFPKQLALMLEQGETIVHFTVRADGRLQGSVKVVKSAGFREFDDEAVAAVTRAAPFPRLERGLSVSMPIAFDNPVVR